MAHNITDTDGAVFHKQAAWHGLGLVIQEDMSPTQAMELAGLNWEVELTGPVMAGDALTDDYKAVIRKDTNTILSIQSPDYKPVQNHEVFDLAYNLGDDIKVESALSMQGGRRLVVLCKTGTMDAGNANDPVEQYMALISSHDGTLATQGLPTSVRIVCQNTLSQAMAAGGSVLTDSPTLVILRRSVRLWAKLSSSTVLLVRCLRSRLLLWLRRNLLVIRFRSSGWMFGL